MKQGKIFGLILSVINIVLIAVCIFFYLRMDKDAPKLEFQANDLIYVMGMDETRLLEGITAYDSHDGDITNRIVIEKKIENKEENALIVFYAVSDEGGNVAKASREFTARFFDTNEEFTVNEIKEAGIEAELDVEVVSKEKTEEKTEKETETEAEEKESSESEDLSDEMPSPSPDASPTPTEAPTAEPTQRPVEQVRVPEEVKPTEAPVGIPNFTLKVSEIKTQVGIKLALVDVIGTLSDDIDSYETLFHNIQISKYDVNTPGRYGVTLFTEDSDGNQSQVLPLTVIVE